MWGSVQAHALRAMSSCTASPDVGVSTASSLVSIEGEAIDTSHVTSDGLTFWVLFLSTCIQISHEVFPLKILMLTQRDSNYHLPIGLNVKPQDLNFIPYACEQVCQMAGQLIYFCKV